MASGSACRVNAIVLLLSTVLANPTVAAATMDTSLRDSPVDSCYEGNIVDAVDFVNRAALLIQQRGSGDAFRKVMDPGGGFIKGDVYVFVLNLEGTIVANGDAPESVGSNALAARDQHGNYFVREILRRAAISGDGWIGYHWFSPCNGRLRPKQVFFRRVDRFVVCSGFYNTLGQRAEYAPLLRGAQ